MNSTRTPWNETISVPAAEISPTTVYTHNFGRHVYRSGRAYARGWGRRMARGWYINCLCGTSTSCRERRE